MMKFTIRIKIFVACYLAIFAIILEVNAQITDNKKPNILFILADDFAPYGIGNGPKGSTEVKTPNIDELAQRGVRFNNAYILGANNGAVCSPSRAMLMTGRSFWKLPSSFHAMWEVEKDQKGQCPYISFPEHFKKNGYYTFATGKQHNGDPLVEKGFMQAKAIKTGGSDHFALPVRDFTPEMGWSKSYKKPGIFSSELFANEAVNFLQNYSADDPFLMYVAFFAPHDPRTAPDKYAAMYDSKSIPLPKNFMPTHPFPKGENHMRDEQLEQFPRRASEIPKHLADYYAMITATDYEIGRILKALEESEKADNTIVVFSSDNGLAIGRHGLMGKQNVYEHSSGIPLIVSGPGIPKNKETEALVYLHDMFPTMCDIADISVPKSVETESMWAIMQYPEKKGRSELFCTYTSYDTKRDVGKGKNRDQYIQFNYDRKGVMDGHQLSPLGSYKRIPWLQRSLQKGQWKLIVDLYGKKETVQLFNIKKDPDELYNLAHEKKQKARIKKLRRLLDKKAKQHGDPARINKPQWNLLKTYPDLKGVL